MNKTSLVSALCGVLLFSPASARVFNSSLKLKVYMRGSGEVPDRLLGFTPSRRGHTVRIPLHQLWYVRPVGPVNAFKLDQLARLLRKEEIPGLDLSDHWELTNDSVSHLRLQTQLVMLDISRTKISDAGLPSLKSCRALAILVLPEAVTNEGLKALKKLRNLREINLDQTQITDEGLNILTLLPRLENIDLSSTHVTDAGVAYLQRLPHLRRLVLGAAVTDACSPHLAELKDLREVDISQTPIGAPGLAALAALPNLETVYLGKTVTDTGLKALSQSRSLRTLDLTRTAITDKGVKHLANVKTLEEISLSQTSVGNACLTSLAELPALRMLELSETQVTSAGLAPLARLKKLEVISLSWQTLSREDLQGMAKLKQLKTIVLNGVPLSESTMAQLKRLGTPSPWDSIAGLEHAQMRDTAIKDHQILGAPVAVARQDVMAARMKAPTPLSSPAVSGSPVVMNAPLSAGGINIKTTPEGHQAITPKATPPLSSKEEQLVSLPAKPESIEAHKPVSRVTEQPRLRQKESTPHAVSPAATPVPARGDENPAATAPVEVTPKKVSEENLLKVITLQSNPAHAGSFAGLSGMRQLRHTETVASLNSITADMSQSSIREQEDKPENYLGDISVGAGHSH